MTDSGAFQPIAGAPQPAAWADPGRQPTSAYLPAPRRTDGAAIAAFVLALTSFIYWVLPAIVALVLATASKRNIAASEGRLSGRNLANAAQALAGFALVGAVIILTVSFLG